jgi:type I restriction enzyme S subunit
MSSEWPLEKLGDITVNLDTKRRPVKEADRKPGPYPYYGASGIVDYVDGYIFDGDYLLVAEDGENLRTRQTPIAFRACGKFWVNNHAHIVVGNDRASTRYLEYAVLGTNITSYLTGAVMPKLTQGNLNRIEVPCPPRDVQDAIVGVLGSLDDRITLLRETNATLEAIARALFKSWFVDFDPVRAKMEGRVPEGMDEATAALFPDGLEASLIGAVPTGWPVKRLDDLLVLQRGFDLPAQDRVPGPYPIIAASGPSGTHHEAVVKGPGVVTGRSGVLGRVFLELGDYWPLNTALWVKEFKAATPCFAYELLSLLDFKSFNAGSAVPTLNRNHVHGLPYVVPPSTCVEAFEAIASKLHQRVKANNEQTQTLATLRDTLLPRLISGQLRLPEAESLLAEAL